MDSHTDATAQAALIAAGDASPRELAESAIERIEALNPELNAVIHPLFEQALETEPANGPFRGVPILIKDLVCQTAGDPYHEGARFLRELGWRAEEDTWLASRLRQAGFVFVGKTNTPEFGILPTTEPVALRGDPQPVEHRAFDGRVEWRLGRGRGRRHGGDRPRQRRRRLDPHPRLLLRARGAQANARPGFDGADRRLRLGGSARSSWSRARYATRPPCSSGCRTRRPASPTSRPTGSGPTPRRWARTRAA